MKTSEVHSQPWTLFDHGIWKSSINFAKSWKFVIFEYIEHSLCGSHFLFAMIYQSSYFGEFDRSINHWTSHTCHEAWGHQFCFLRYIEFVCELHECLENCELQSSGRPYKQIHWRCSSIESFEEAASVFDKLSEVLQTNGFIELQFCLDEI